MAEALSLFWRGLPVAAQDWALVAALLAPGLLIGSATVRGSAVGPLVAALILRFRWTNAVFVGLIALAIGLGVALAAQERALRGGSARAADAFPVVIAAPGDRVRAMLAAVYARPSDTPLLDGEALARLQADPQIALLAPLGYGDSHRGAPVVGTTAAFVAHLAGAPAEGRHFGAMGEAVAGAATGLRLGETFAPQHGHGHGLAGDLHEGVEVRVVGVMRPTGTPWDRAILTPIEHVWWVHGLATGHDPAAGERLGPPWDPAFFPGAPAFVAVPRDFAAAYRVQARHDRGDTMAFFPGAVLAELHALLGDVRAAMSLMAGMSQALVAAGVLAGLAALSRLFARRFALLRALGAPRRHVAATVWAYATTLVGAGSLLGVGVGAIAAAVVSGFVTERTGVLVAPTLGPADLQPVAAFFSLAAVLALIPAFAAYRRPPVEDLRAV